MLVVRVIVIMIGPSGPRSIAGESPAPLDRRRALKSRDSQDFGKSVDRVSISTHFSLEKVVPMRARAAMCSFLPPHILRRLSENGDQAQRDDALRSLELSAQMRGERAALARPAEMLVIAAGGKRRRVFDAQTTRELPGTLVRSEGKPSRGDAAADEAYDGAGKTYDLYRNVYARNSIDGRGMRIDSTVHYGVRFDNAQWNGQQMVYGDGDNRLFRRFTGCLEIIGHELTHGVTQHTAALAYADEPGALNEHFSDVFGVLVKQYTLKQIATKADWLVGAGLLTDRVQGNAIRSMKAPGTAYDDPVLGRDPQPAHPAGC